MCLRAPRRYGVAAVRVESDCANDSRKGRRFSDEPPTFLSEGSEGCERSVCAPRGGGADSGQCTETIDLKEVVEEILKAEEEAKRDIARAHEEASRLVAEAGARAKALVEESRARAREEAHGLIEEAKKAAEERRTRMLEDAARRARELKETKKKEIDAAVEKCLRRILDVEGVR